MFLVYQVAIDIYLQICTFAVPVAVIFEIGNLIVGTLMNAAFGGRLWLGKK